jgi:hypothetical protein
MNIARWFSYTRLLERSLIKERRQRERERAADRAQWDTERRELEASRERVENVVFLAHGVNPPHHNPASVPNKENSDRVSIPRAIGPIGQFGLHARNESLRADQERRTGEEVRRDTSKDLPLEAQERIRQAAEEKGLISPENGAAVA